jgi:branched-chain amino acid transport system permease protein
VKLVDSISASIAPVAARIGVSAADTRRLLVPSVLLLLVGLGGSLAPGTIIPSTWAFVATFGVIQSMVALSAGMLFGRAGLLSLCPLAFAAISAWVVLWFNVNAKLPFFVMVAIGALSAIPAGLLVGGLALRLRGVHLAVVTLAFGVAVVALFSRHNFPGTLDPVFRPVRPAGFTGDRMYFLLCFAVLVVTGLALERLGRSRVGRSWRAVRYSERATAAAGLSVPQVKLSAFITSALISGIAGGLYAGQLQGSIDVRAFNALLSLAVVAAAVMFGAQSLSGAVVAGFLAALIPEAMRRLGWAAEYPQILFGLGAVHALSQGGGGISATFPWRRARRSTAPPPEATPLMAATPGLVEGAAVLEIRGLGVRYGALAALDDVDLIVPSGRVVGVIGPNGAGKSTLVDAACGFLSGYQGTVTLSGRSIDGLSATARARAGLRRTFQQGRAIPELTVGEYLDLCSSRHLDAAEIDEALSFFGLPPAGEPIEFVDVGTRRVLEVAAAVASGPAVAFLDEPAAGLGADEAAALARHIMAIPQRFGCSVVLIEHNIELVAEVCSTITVLDFGVVIANGTPSQVLADPRVTAAYLGEEIDDLAEPVAGGA